MLTHIDTCRHISAHVGTYQHMSAHIGTCRHISAHVSMSTCADICQHADKIQLIGIIWAKNDVTCRHMSAHVGMLPGVDTCRHVPAHVCRHPDCDILSNCEPSSPRRIKSVQSRIQCKGTSASSDSTSTTTSSGSCIQVGGSRGQCKGMNRHIWADNGNIKTDMQISTYLKYHCTIHLLRKLQYCYKNTMKLWIYHSP